MGKEEFNMGELAGQAQEDLDKTKLEIEYDHTNPDEKPHMSEVEADVSGLPDLDERYDTRSNARIETELHDSDIEDPEA